jgi:hypothetical protein
MVDFISFECATRSRGQRRKKRKENGIIGKSGDGGPKEEMSRFTPFSF